MAMDGTQMGSEVAAAIAATGAGAQLDSYEQAAARAQWQVICRAIVDHIKYNALDSQGGNIT